MALPLADLSSVHVREVVVNSLERAFEWCSDALDRAADAFASPATVIDVLSNRTLTTSSSFSGVGTDVTADE
eukprot:8383239-Alexandrium_andersonii.AAC.1